MFRVGVEGLHLRWSLGDRHEVWLLLAYHFMCLGQCDAAGPRALCVVPAPSASSILSTSLWRCVEGPGFSP